MDVKKGHLLPLHPEKKKPLSVVKSPRSFDTPCLSTLERIEKKFGDEVPVVKKAPPRDIQKRGEAHASAPESQL